MSSEIIDHLDLNSASGTQLNLEALYQLAPSVFTEVRDPKTGETARKIDFDALRALLGDEVMDEGGESYEFTWVGKRAAKAEAARSTDKTLRPVVEDSVDWENTQNLYIEGDNLEVLKLLQRSYLGKVKMIYIDPPYNTGNDFVYNDDFARTAAEEDLEAGNVDELGLRYRKNTDTNGKFHSDWCSMLYSRLLVARSLMTEDGVIFISIDDNEVRNLRNICDEVFGEKCRIETIVWKNKYGAGAYTIGFISVHEYILCYSKNPIINLTSELDEEGQSVYNKKDEKYPIRGGYMTQPLMTNSLADRPNLMYSIEYNGNTIYPRKQWVWSKERLLEAIENNEVEFNELKDGTFSVRSKAYLRNKNGKIRRGKPLSLMNGPFNQDGTKDIRNLFDGKSLFDFTKPSELIKKFISLQINNNEDDSFIVLDFFSGSSTTAHAVMRLNAEDGGHRKFIMVQLPEETPEDSEARKAGYKTIPEIAKERIRRAGKKIKEENPLTTQDLDTGFRVFRLDESNYLEVKKSPKEYDQDMLGLFADNIKMDRTDLDLLFGSMLAWGVQLDMPMTTEQVDGCTIYTVNEGDLVACFSDSITDKVVSAMADKMPLRILFRDSCFTDDAQKINIYEKFKQLLDWGDDEAFKNIKVI
ncbi:MAG: site-specific DNA-methyltransferase [Prevotella sp.]|nr:site-specific DNA-methyltransferase [Prevotella sp.]